MLAYTLDLYQCTGVSKSLDVTFGGIKIDHGNEVPYSTAHYSGTPIIKLASANESAYYTVAMIDPDAPTPENPTVRSVRHFLVGNIPGANMITGLSWQSTTILSDFINPTPPNVSAAHRYVQLAYLQPQGKVSFGPVDPSPINFNVTAFADEYGFGLPIGCNFFRTQFACSSDLAQCGGGVSQEGPICCGSADHSCYEQTPYYYQCRTSCPKGATPPWACDTPPSAPAPVIKA